MLVSAFIMAATVIGVPVLWSTRTASNEVARASEIAACRAIYEAEIEVARTEAIAALADLDLVVVDGLAALADGDPIDLAATISRAPAARARLTSAIGAIEAATDSYASALEDEHITDTCQETPP